MTDSKKDLYTTQQALAQLANSQRALQLQRFFKTNPGEYGYGDVFIGVSVPVIRKLATQFQTLTLHDLAILIASPIHEERLLALLILMHHYKKSDTNQQENIYQFYLAHTRYINNWDLVDTSAPYIIGNHIHTRDRKILYTFASSTLVWERRIAIVATLYLIRKNHFDETMKIAYILLSDKHDLIHKAVGWMLREVGKKDKNVLLPFLDAYATTMPRTMLRYALERCTESERQKYMKKKS